jgi:hypothetical protein
LDSLRNELDKLQERELAYVMARSKGLTDKSAYTECGISRSSFYGWEEDRRQYLNEIAQRIKREASFRALMILQDNAEKAAETIGNLMESRNENIKLRASQDTLDRTVGKATQPVEVSGKDGGKIVVNLSWDDDEPE